MSRPVVSDAGPLISLVQIDHLHLLRDLYGQIVVPPTVAREAGPAVGELPPWFKIQRPPSSMASLYPARRLDAGEYEALLLSLSIGAEPIVIDDRDARSWGLRHGLTVIGTLGLLVRAKAAGIVPVVRPLVDRLRSYGLLHDRRSLPHHSSISR